MANYPPTPEWSKKSADTENCQDYAGAMRTISAARGLFLLLLILSLLFHLGVYCCSKWTTLLAPTQIAEEEIASPSPEAAPGTIDLADAGQESFAWLYYAIELTMPMAEFVGQLACAALVLCYLLGANVVLSGRLGGVRGSISAFFWMVVVLALLFPWDRCLGGVGKIPGVYATFEEVTHLPDDLQGGATFIHYARFLGYPVLALLLALVGDRRYAKGYRLAQRQIEARLNVRAV
ncbi:MAG: hypothetical protein ACYSUQ_06035 [Planctomycetota bacterium]|jgi:hypothetical protein